MDLCRVKIQAESKSNMETLSHQYKNKCEICKKILSSKGNLKIHIQTIHERQTEYICGICKTEFHNEPTFKSHMKIHEEENVYQCNFTRNCGNAFLDKKSYENHMEGIHKNVKCGICDEYFSQKSILKSHISNVHEGEKIYFCKFFKNCCGAFLDPEVLEAHVDNVHKLEHMKCHICNKYFSGSEKLTEHLISDHNQ